MNYFEIGQRIRKIRKANNLSQEQLAERVGISTTHMSHIETGNTKLSLPVLVDIAGVLSVSEDELLHDTAYANKASAAQEMSDILDSCTATEACILLDILRASAVALHRHKQ